MKVGLLSEFYYPWTGGVSEHLRALGSALETRGHQVVVISGGARGPIQVEGPPVRRLGRGIAVPYNGSRSRITVGWRLWGDLARLLTEERLDVLHVHNPLMPTLPLGALAVARCPVVATFHSCYDSDRALEFFRQPVSELLRKVAARIAVSAAALRTAARDFPGEYQIIPNGVDLPFFRKALRLRRPTRPHGPWRLLFVGALVPRKGLPLLIECAERLLRLGTDFELVIVGDGPHGPRMARRVGAGLRSRIRFAGSLPPEQLLAAYAEADVLCAPSLERESFGMVLLEAMAAGVPVVASNIDGYREVVDNGHDGILLPPRDPEVWAKEILALLQDRARRASLIAAGLHTSERYRWDAVAARVEETYCKVSSLPAMDAYRRVRTTEAVAGAAEPSLG